MLRIISYDIWDEIIGDLNMFDIVKLSHVNEDMYEMCNRNDVWERCYNVLFDRRIITKDSKHIGPITWFHCRCGPYPGWSRIHNEIENGVCKNINHYENIGQKVSKRKYKDYKNKTMKKYIQLLKRDNFVKNIHVHKYERENTLKKMNELQNEVNTYNEIIHEYEVASKIIQI